MAINKDIELDTGQTVSHHIFDVNFDNVHNLITVVWEKYHTATKFVNGKRPVEVGAKSYQLADVPAGIKTKLKDVLVDIETYMVANDPDFIGGVRVKDNGNPIL